MMMMRHIKIWIEFLTITLILAILLNLPKPFDYIGYLALGMTLMYYIIKKYQKEE